jgi:YbbR domain-containing protein
MEALVRAIRESIGFLGTLLRAAFGSVRQNGGLAALSVVLAFGIWIFVTEAENPTRERVLPVDIPVQPVNVPADVALGGELQPVRVRVKVAEDVFDSLTEADFEATVDLDGLTVGEYELPVEVRPLTSRGGLRIEDVLPERINVQLAQLTAKSIPVVVEVQGTPPTGYSMGTPETEDEEVLVTGPQGVVDQVTQATAVVDVQSKTDPVDQAVRLAARDSRGTLVQGVALDPAFTEVRIEIQEERFSRSMAVSPQLSGSPADGYNVVGVSVTPTAVTVRGEEAYIEGTSAVGTKSIDIAGATGNVVRTVSLDLPEGAEVTGGVPVVTVTVKIAPTQGVMQFAVPVTATGLGEGLSIGGALPVATVTLLGDLPALRQLSPNDVGARIDLTGRDAGTYRMPVQVIIPAGMVAQSVSPAEIDVTLERR